MMCKTCLPSSRTMSSSKPDKILWTFSKQESHLLLMQRLQAVQRLNITDHVCRGERKTHTQTHWMYLSETFWLCLVVMVRMYICRAASRSAASYFSSGPNRSKTTSLQLCGRAGQQRYMRVSESCSREEPCIRPFRHSRSRAPPPAELK